MRKAIYFLVVPSLLILCSCATPGWYKAGVSRMDTENSLAQCEYNVSINQVKEERYERTVNNCMMAQGFRYVDNVPKDNPGTTYNEQPAFSPAPASPTPASPAANTADSKPEGNQPAKDEWWK